MCNAVTATMPFKEERGPVTIPVVQTYECQEALLSGTYRAFSALPSIDMF
jgi:hypothetical protein